MISLNKKNGETITDEKELISQSIDDIITTPIGTRVMRRDYGSVIPDLIDQPLNQATVLRVYAATAAAIMKWEPRLKITGIRMAFVPPSGAQVEVSGTIGNDNTTFTVPVGSTQ